MDTQELIKAIQIQRMNIIKSKLIEKGFARYVAGIDKQQRFPRVCEVIRGDWSYYYADNNTEHGAFIVAIKESCCYDINNVGISFTIKNELD
jgi:hypothetical protein